MENFGSFLYTKCLDFSIRIAKLYTFLCEEKKEFVFSKQILRSGTSIGANLAEAQYGISKKDFYAKTYIALKETAETMYWLEVLHRAQYLSDKEFQSLFNDCEEIKKLFVTITKTTKRTLTPNSSLSTPHS